MAVARNPVTMRYARENGAPGAISQAIRVGRALLRHGGQPDQMVAAVTREIGGEEVTAARITHLSLKLEGGFDSGLVELETGHKLTFWNEYMTLEHDGRRLGTFPYLIMTFDAETGLPVTSAELRAGKKVHTVWTHRQNLILGASMRDPFLFASAEEAVGQKIIEYVF